MLRAVRENGLVGTRWARFARGWAAAGFATFVAAFSHVVAGGSAPTVFSVAVALVISAMIATLLAGRTVSLARLTVSIGLSQVLFHSLFSSLSAPVAASHEHSPALFDVVSHDHADMWLAHTIAGIVTIVAFRYAEGAFWGLATTAGLFITRLVGVIIPIALPRFARPEPLDFVVPSSIAILAALPRRGPPVAFGA